MFWNCFACCYHVVNHFGFTGMSWSFQNGHGSNPWFFHCSSHQSGWKTDVHPWPWCKVVGVDSVDSVDPSPLVPSARLSRIFCVVHLNNADVCPNRTLTKPQKPFTSQYRGLVKSFYSLYLGVSTNRVYMGLHKWD